MRNVVEDVVALQYAELLPTVKGACTCAICREDTLVYALNRLEPHYVATIKGEILSKLQMGADQGRADVAIALLDGFRHVKAAPRCGREPVID